MRSIAALALLVGVAGAVGSAATTNAQLITAARLRLTIATTSNWTELTLSPGNIVASHLVSRSGDGRYRVSAQGVALSGVHWRESVTIDVVLGELSGSPTFAVRVDKGFLGVTDVSIANTNATPYTVTDLTDALHELGGQSQSVAVPVDRDQMMSTVPLALRKADPRKLVLAAYYPWFSRYTSSQLADDPSRPRSVWDARGVLSMTQQAKAAGINGFAVSWHGDSADGPAMDLVRKAAEATGQVFTAYLEAPSATRTKFHSPAFRVRQWLLQALSRKSSPSFLKAGDGVPVVFVYGMESLKPQEWRDVLVDVAGHAIRVHLVGDSLDPAYRAYEWGVHRYSTLDSAGALTRWSRSTELVARAAAAIGAGAPTLYAGTVSPGFNDTRLRGSEHRVISRGHNGSRYDETWAAALAGDPDWLFVSTWNEWYEDTQVEPGVKTRGRALAQTRAHAAAWRR